MDPNSGRPTEQVVIGGESQSDGNPIPDLAGGQSIEKHEIHQNIEIFKEEDYFIDTLGRDPETQVNPSRNENIQDNLESKKIKTSVLKKVTGPIARTFSNQSHHEELKKEKKDPTKS